MFTINNVFNLDVNGIFDKGNGVRDIQPSNFIKPKLLNKPRKDLPIFLCNRFLSTILAISVKKPLETFVKSKLNVYGI